MPIKSKKFLGVFDFQLFINDVRTVLRHLTRAIWQMGRKLFGTDRQLIQRYFKNYDVKKLHIGCGYHLLDGWLNSDYYPADASILHLDATEPFPFADNTFDYIFSEHMIEHIPYAQGARMLAECFRVLKPGGRIRLVTPNLPFVLDLYRSDKLELQQAYIQWSTSNFVVSEPGCGDTFVINNFVRDWGHQFIYDEKTLSAALAKAGFTAIKRGNLNESEDIHFQNLENESRMPAGFLKLESLIIEAQKP